MIFENFNTVQILNLIRAVTDPFPSAFTYINLKKVYIWQKNLKMEKYFGQG